MSENEQSDNTISENASINTKKSLLKKKKKKGIIYISQIPKYMNVTMIREIMSNYGEVGRVYLQLFKDKESESNNSKKLKKKKAFSKHFTEGWVEFEKKKIAKYVAATLNNTQISTRKKSKFYDSLWNIKYLPRFKWIHLSERLAYERAMRKQRLRTEISQAKREVNFFSHNVDVSEKLNQKKEKIHNDQKSTENVEKSEIIAPKIKQRETDMEIRKRKNQTNITDRTELLKSLYN